MKTQVLLAAAISGVLSTLLPAQTVPAPTQSPAATGVVQPGAIQFRSLQAVLDARERRQDWHEAAQQAADKVQVDPIKTQLVQRLSGVAPVVAKALVARPQENALVEVNVYKDASGKQSLATVTFDGLGSDLGGDFLPGVLADVKKPPEAEGIPQGLVFDPEASSYMVFFLGTKGLQAGDIPETKLKQSIIAASNHQRDVAAHQDQETIERTRLQQDAATAQQRALDSAQPAAAEQHAVIPEYPNQNYGYNDGYYYPGVGVPIVITGDGYANTPEWRNRQRVREEGLEQKYRQTHPAAPGQPGGAPINSSTGAASAGVNAPAGAAGVTTTSGSSGVRVPPGSAGIASTPGQAGVATTPGTAGVATTPGTAGVTTPPGGQGVETPGGTSGVRTPPAKSGVENPPSRSTTRTPASSAHEGSAEGAQSSKAGGSSAGTTGGSSGAASGGGAAGSQAGGGAKK